MSNRELKRKSSRENEVLSWLKVFTKSSKSSWILEDLVGVLGWENKLEEWEGEGWWKGLEDVWKGLDWGEGFEKKSLVGSRLLERLGEVMGEGVVEACGKSSNRDGRSAETADRRGVIEGEGKIWPMGLFKVRGT